jgi:type IV pilus assembly protein PilB
MRLGDVLVERGVITEPQLVLSLRYQSDTGARLGDALTHLGYITPQQLKDALTWQDIYGLSTLGELLPNPGASTLLTEKFCRARKVLPIDFDSGGALILAMADPADVMTVDDVRLITGMETRAVATTLAALNEAWEFVYAVRVQLASDHADSEPAGSREEEAAQQASVVAVLDQIITTAMRRGASDIHFEPQADRMIVRVRVDGILHHLTDIVQGMQHGVVSRIKILGDMDIAERRLPQDGRATFRSDEQSIDLRIAAIPTVFGENVTIRLLDDRTLALKLEELDMAEDHLELFRKAVKRPWGEILVTGPTGSGKSTTLYAGLAEINDSKVKIYTVEDPVERRMPGVLQSQVRSNIGLTFASLLRSLVRSDPDVIMIGEIRDHETALVATEASLTGHLVLSTLHTNDAPTAIARLVEMGLPAYLVASSLELIVAQRLARRLCPRCRQTVSLTKSTMTIEERNFLRVDEAVLGKAVGCDRCFGTGYSGRIGLFQLLPVTSEIRRLVLNNATTDEMREYADSAGIRSLREDGRLKVLAGLTTIEEVERVTA